MKRLIFALLFVSGCDLSESYKAQAQQSSNASYIPVGSGARISIERVAVFKDSLAYNGDRGIYIIRDNDSGQEFIGISGIGISERGGHQVGKVWSTDER